MHSERKIFKKDNVLKQIKDILSGLYIKII